MSFISEPLLRQYSKVYHLFSQKTAKMFEGTHLDLVFKKSLFLDQLSFHPLSCRLGFPQVILQFLQILQRQQRYQKHRET